MIRGFFNSMKYIISTALLLSTCYGAQAQHSYEERIVAHRQQYKEAFITEPRSPLKGGDTAYLRFYNANSLYRVVATITETPEAKPFDMPTYSGKTKQFRQYGVLTFAIGGKQQALQVYQNLKLLEDTAHAQHLFVPFTDETTYTETYGGGRYIDLSTADIKGGRIVLDFNKCYNPYCAYAGGYNCPIPPAENRLKIPIRAGEKLFGKEH